MNYQKEGNNHLRIDSCTSSASLLSLIPVKLCAPAILLTGNTVNNRG